MQPRKFKVTLVPAWDEGLCIATSPFDTLHKEEFEASSVAEMVDKVAAIATTVGKSCQSYVSLDAAAFADRIIGDLTKTDAAVITSLIDASAPVQRRRQQRFAERVHSIIAR